MKITVGSEDTRLLGRFKLVSVSQDELLNVERKLLVKACPSLKLNI